MQLLKQSTAATVLVGPVLDSTGAAVTTAVIGDFNLTKNGTTAALAAAATATHSHNGHYLIALTTTNTDTVGRLTISANNSSHAMATHRFSVLLASVFDALITNATNASGGLISATGSITGATGTLANTTNITAGTITTATNVTTVNGLAAGVITAASIAADAITDAKVANDVTIASVTGSVGSVVGAVGSVTAAVTVGTINANVVNASALAADAVAEIQSGLATATNLIDTQNALDQLISDLPANVFGLLTVNHNGAGTFGALLNSLATSVDAIPTNSELTAALGTGSWATAIPWNASWDAEVQSECTDALTAYGPYKYGDTVRKARTGKTDIEETVTKVT